jgi:hypothetical protein
LEPHTLGNSELTYEIRIPLIQAVRPKSVEVPRKNPRMKCRRLICRDTLERYGGIEPLIQSFLPRSCLCFEIIDIASVEEISPGK